MTAVDEINDNIPCPVCGQDECVCDLQYGGSDEDLDFDEDDDSDFHDDYDEDEEED